MQSTSKPFFRKFSKIGDDDTTATRDVVNVILPFLHAIDVLLQTGLLITGFEVLNRNNSAILVRLVESSWIPSFRHLPNVRKTSCSHLSSRQFQQTSRGTSSQDSS